MRSQKAVIREVLRRVPGSMRRLAREAGITHVAILRAREGDFPLAPEKVRAIVRVLRSWSRTCMELADRLEATATEKKEGRDGKA